MATCGAVTDVEHKRHSWQRAGVLPKHPNEERKKQVSTHSSQWMLYTDGKHELCSWYGAETSKHQNETARFNNISVTIKPNLVNTYRQCSEEDVGNLDG